MSVACSMMRASDVRRVGGLRQLIKAAQPSPQILERVVSAGFSARKPKHVNLFTPATKHHTLRRFDFQFMTSATSSASLPPPTKFEFALIGRSNCGKSTLLNALFGKPGLARTSPRPGHTQSLNTYRSSKGEVYLTDMPGYGFAYANDNKVSAWSELSSEYLSSRRSLRRVFVLVDARVLLKKLDMDMLEQLDRNKQEMQLVLTKCDGIPATELAKRVAVAETLLLPSSYLQGPVLLTSARLGLGVASVAEVIAKLCASPAGATEGKRGSVVTK